MSFRAWRSILLQGKRDRPIRYRIEMRNARTKEGRMCSLHEKCVAIESHPTSPCIYGVFFELERNRGIADHWNAFLCLSCCLDY